MPASDPNLRPQQDQDRSLRGALRIDAAATAARVNRTHRVVRERARIIQARRSRVRSLYVPLAIFSALLLGICTAVWSILDQQYEQYGLEPMGIPVASYQMLVLLLWSVPVTAALMAVIWFRKPLLSRDGESGQ
jgi:hypothetical protein